MFIDTGVPLSTTNGSSPLSGVAVITPFSSMQLLSISFVKYPFSLAQTPRLTAPFSVKVFSIL